MAVFPLELPDDDAEVLKPLLPLPPVLEEAPPLVVPMYVEESSPPHAAAAATADKSANPRTD
jgi:hypothetical protein